MREAGVGYHAVRELRGRLGVKRGQHNGALGRFGGVRQAGCVCPGAFLLNPAAPGFAHGLIGVAAWAIHGRAIKRGEQVFIQPTGKVGFNIAPVGQDGFHQHDLDEPGLGELACLYARMVAPRLGGGVAGDLAIITLHLSQVVIPMAAHAQGIANEGAD